MELGDLLLGFWDPLYISGTICRANKSVYNRQIGVGNLNMGSSMTLYRVRTEF